MSARSMDSVKASARQMLKPQVGMGKMVSALGKTKPAWETKTPRSGPRSGADKAMEAMEAADAITASPRREYHVGRARARGQLRHAMLTQDEEAQLRRLEQALEIPAVQYDQDMIPGLNKVVGQAAMLSLRINNSTNEHATVPDQLQLLSATMKSTKSAPQKPAKAVPAPAAAGELEAEQQEGEAGEEELDEEAAAQSATKIQSLFRGKKDREEVRIKKEQAAAATKIQARYRGKAARGRTEKIIQERYGDYLEEDLGEQVAEGEEGAEEEYGVEEGN